MGFLLLLWSSSSESILVGNLSWWVVLVWHNHLAMRIGESTCMYMHVHVSMHVCTCELTSKH